MKKIAILGSTGSIGRQTLAVARELKLSVLSLSCKKNVKLLAEQIMEFSPELVSVHDDEVALDLSRILSAKGLLKKDQPEIISGPEGLIAAATRPGLDLVMAAIVGFSGLRPVLAALEAGTDIALANKETLVAGGSLVMELARKKKAKLIPVDSEHSAIWQCLMAADEERFKKIFLTASGGPFLGFTKRELENITPAQALKHPTWEMGAKISIDSASMMNKGLEIIEACHLFSCTPEKIEVVVHPQSIVHSLVELEDGSVLAQLGFPDMKIPIRLALTWPKRPAASYYESFNPFDQRAALLSFEPPDEELFPSLRLAREAFLAGGLAPCILNAANEAAVALFLEKKIAFREIFTLVEEALAASRDNFIQIDYEILAAVHNDTIERIKRRY